MAYTHSGTTIVIIGGGFSGIAVATNLIRHSSQKLRIFIIEKTQNFIKGVAYSTPESFHLLNVPGDNMGLFAQNPNHFMEWLKAHEPIWRQADEAFQTLPIEPARFYPRKLYGIYLQHLWQDSLKEAEQKGIKVTVLADEALDVTLTEHHTAQVILKHHTVPAADHVVLATGNAPVKSFSYANGVFLCQERYIENMWAENPESILNQKDLSSLPASAHIAIVGTGLTMVDAFLSLRKKGFKGKITAISRHGKLPLPHQSFKAYTPFVDSAHYPKTARDLLRLLHSESKKAIKHGYDWRAVLQQFRPDTNAVWAQLPIKERRIILRKLFSYWNIHRHRIPAEILALLQQDIASGALTIIPGTIYYIGGKRNSQLKVSYRKRGEDFVEYLTADYVINCSGPEADISEGGNPLLIKLRDKGFIHASPLRMGIELTANGRVKGKSPDIFHALGSPVAGEKLESTSVPDIRVQAAETAEQILSRNEENLVQQYHYFI